MKNNKGFTLIELLLVVSIISVLVIIGIPTFNKSLEKARQATDVANARSLKTQLATLIMDGSIEFVSPYSQEENYCGVWVLVWHDNKKPNNYNNYTGTVFFGANNGIKINGQPVTSNWNINKSELQNLLAPCFKNGNMKSYSKTGWDWYLVQYTYLFDSKKIVCTIKSGFQYGDSRAIGGSTNTNIEKYFKK